MTSKSHRVPALFTTRSGVQFWLTAAIGLAVAGLLSLWTVPGVAGKKDNEAKSRLLGDWSKPIPNVSIALEDATVGEALEDLAETAQWNLVFAGASDRGDRGDMTLKLKDKPATELLEILLEMGNLEARLVNNVLIVQPRGPALAEKEASGLEIQIDDDKATIVAGSLNIHGDRDDRISTGGDARVDAGETVKDAVAIGGSLHVAGHVRGDAVAIGGDVHLESGAVVEGEAAAIGGEIHAADDATVGGDRISIGGGVGGLVSPLVHMAVHGGHRDSLFSELLANLVLAVALFVIGLLVISFAPHRVERVSDFMVEQPGHAVLGGLGLMVGFLPLCLLLLVTVIGILVIPVAVILMALLFVMGVTALASRLGERLPIFKDRKTPMGALLIGIGALMVLDLIPIVGTPLLVLLGFVSAGAALLSRFGRPPLDAPAAASDFNFP